MATTIDYIEFVAERVAAAECMVGAAVRFRKMFGEYMVYVNDKPLVLVCDNTPYVKILPCLSGIVGNTASRGYPYGGAKEHYVLDVEDTELCGAVIAALERVTDVPKPKKRKAKAKAGEVGGVPLARNPPA